MQNGMQNVLGSLTSNHIMKILSYKCLKRVFPFILDCRNDIKHDDADTASFHYYRCMLAVGHMWCVLPRAD